MSAEDWTSDNMFLEHTHTKVLKRVLVKSVLVLRDFLFLVALLVFFFFMLNVNVGLTGSVINVTLGSSAKVLSCLLIGHSKEAAAYKLRDHMGHHSEKHSSIDCAHHNGHPRPVHSGDTEIALHFYTASFLTLSIYKFILILTGSALGLFTN